MSIDGIGPSHNVQNFSDVGSVAKPQVQAPKTYQLAAQKEDALVEIELEENPDTVTHYTKEEYKEFAKQLFQGTKGLFGNKSTVENILFNTELSSADFVEIISEYRCLSAKGLSNDIKRSFYGKEEKKLMNELARRYNDALECESSFVAGRAQSYLRGEYGFGDDNIGDIRVSNMVCGIRG